MPICELDSEKARAEVLKVISRLESWRLLEPMRSLRSKKIKQGSLVESVISYTKIRNFSI